MQLKSLHDLDATEGTVQLRQETLNDDTSVLVLIPHPSPNDPNDPLRWPTWKKHLAFSAVCSFTFLTNYAIGGLSPAFYPLSIEFGTTITETSDLLLWPILILGLFNFFWVPVANYFGKRPVFVVASLILCVCYIWGAIAQSFKSLLWSNCIAAFAGSSTEALGAAMVNDLYFLHERGTKMGIYMSAISLGNSIGPLICGFVVESLGWRWHKWMAAIFTGVTFLVVVFFVPETRYDRDFSKSLSSNQPVSSTQSLAEEEERNPASAEGKSTHYLSTGMDSPSPPYELVQIPKKTLLQELNLYSGTANTNLVKMFIRPFPLIAYPAVTFAFLSYAATLAWVVAVNILNSFVLQAPPYNWGAAKNGLINIPGIIGNIIGSICGGWLVDKYCDWRTRKNHGVFQPESRLFLLIIPFVVVPVGCILFGYGVQDHLGWFSLFWSYGMISVGLTAVPTITMTYVSDCYLPVAADALLLINGLKNIVAFGFLYGVVPWVTKSGYVNSFGTQAGIFVAVLLLGGLPLYWFGQNIRHRSAQWRIIL